LVDFVAKVTSAHSADVKLVDKFAGAAAAGDITEHLQDVQLHLQDIKVEGEFVEDQLVKTLAFIMEKD
jgi:hypothetical protein